MIRRINKLLIALALVCLVCYLFYLNPDTISVRLGPSWTLTGPTAIVLISTFASGIIFCALFAIFFGIKAYWREKKLEDRERRRNKSEKQLLDARSALAAEEWTRARELWMTIVNRDPSNIIARIELSRSLQGAGLDKDAIKVLDAARTAEPTNPEILFRAAELNIAMQNSTAAIDNLALLNYHHPNIKAARMARDLSEGLGRIDDALQYQDMLEKLGSSGPEVEQARLRLELKKLENDAVDDQEKLKEQLHKFVRRNPSSVPALYKLALMESSVGNTEEASRLLLQASRQSLEPQYWQEASKLWVKAGNPERAVAAAKAGTSEMKGADKVRSTLELIKLYLTLNMNEEAHTEIDNFETLLRKENISPDRAITRTILILKGRCHTALGNHQESSKVWEKLSDANFKLERKVIKLDSARREMPPARLSTP